ncbi:hypothetical protein AC622_10795 [Bacillus sp. FJAT-27916]|uniref:hypothetical protein n=1 Tax=Bacillus sp. FJAT-27916 TaxID=1679169 RepID=UPI000670E2CF|nr:hypothetical protein [Bacillus sp. FJAT-27916]KMY44671.1 hypothetical protein AC622_10795 [Bacillus sp. FJAT-27916]
MELIRVDIRMPNILLREIEDYQLNNGISTRTAAILELVRIGLDKKEDLEVYIERGDSQRIDIRIPAMIIDKVEEYQNKNDIRTRAAAMKRLILLGLM